MIEYLDKVIRPLILKLPKMRGYVKGYVKTFKIKHGDKVKNNLLMMRGYKKCKAIRIKIEYLKDTELNALPVCDYRYIKTKIRTYSDNVSTNFCSLNVPEDNIDLESFRVIPIESLLVYESKCYLQVYLNNDAYKIIDKQMTDYYDYNLLENKTLKRLHYNRVDISKGIGPTKSSNSRGNA